MACNLQILWQKRFETNKILEAMEKVSKYKSTVQSLKPELFICSPLRKIKLEFAMINKCFMLAICSVLLFGTARASSPVENEKLILKADQGDAISQFTLGEMYEKGQSVKQDYVEAVKWYDFAAYQGYAPAQYNFGLLYENGLGVAKNYGEAVRWYRLAADQGLASAQMQLGLLYENGLGVAKNYSEAARWYRLAAEQGLASAQFKLALMYEKGQGVAKNSVEASKWYGFASNQVHSTSKVERGVAYNQESKVNGFVN